MNKKLIAGTLMAVLLLVAATLFVAAIQPFSASAAGQAQAGETDEPATAQSGDTKYVEISRSINGEDYSGGVFITYENPEELPDEAHDILGVFVAKSGNTLTVGTGSINVEVDVEQYNDEEPVTTADATYTGDEVDIRFTPDTLFYEDTTVEPELDREDVESGHVTVPRTLAPGSADDIGENMVIRAWGSMVDGQLVADTIVYEPLR